MYKQIPKILNMNKFEDDYVGPYPYSNEEKAKMITNLYEKKNSKDKMHKMRMSSV